MQINQNQRDGTAEIGNKWVGILKMNPEYLQQFRNENLRKLLLREENIPRLEEVLNDHSENFLLLKRAIGTKKEADSTRKVEKGELREVFSEVCRDVNAFLETNTNMPQCRYGDLLNPKGEKITVIALLIAAGFFLYEARSLGLKEGIPALVTSQYYLYLADKIFWMSSNPHYNRFSKKVTIPKRHYSLRTSFIPVAAHEYAHHVQREAEIKPSFSSPRMFRIFHEGHAYGVERYIAEVYKQKENNPFFEFLISNRTIGELKNVYLWSCRFHKREPKQDLLRAISSEDAYYLRRRYPNTHAMGNALFSIYEAEQGNRIYREMIHGRFKFPET